MTALRNIWIVFRREVAGFFLSPLAYVFLFVFVLLSMFFTFIMRDWLKTGNASLTDFFEWHPWIFMVIGPAIGMRLWSDEQRLGTMELLLTMPILPWQAIVGKFLAACLVIFGALLSTISIVFTVCWLGKPDMGVIFSGYIGSFLVGCSTVAIACAVSAVTRSQVACLLISTTLCLILVFCGFPSLTEFVGNLGMDWFADLLTRGGFLHHNRNFSEGRITLQSIVYFASLIGFCLFLTSVIIRSKRS